MSQLTQPQEPGGYRLRVKGHLDQRWSAWFHDLTLTRESDGTTILSGAITDQAELHGLLTKIRDLGISLISVHVIDPPDNANPIRSGLSPDPRGEPAEISQAPQRISDSLIQSRV